MRKILCIFFKALLPSLADLKLVTLWGGGTWDHPCFEGWGDWGSEWSSRVSGWHWQDQNPGLLVPFSSTSPFFRVWTTSWGPRGPSILLQVYRASGGFCRWRSKPTAQNSPFSGNLIVILKKQSTEIHVLLFCQFTDKKKKEKKLKKDKELNKQF